MDMEPMVGVFVGALRPTSWPVVGRSHPTSHPTGGRSCYIPIYSIPFEVRRRVHSSVHHDWKWWREIVQTQLDKTCPPGRRVLRPYVGHLLQSSMG